MKKIVFVFGFFILFFALSLPAKGMFSPPDTLNFEVEEGDTVEYELLIFDPGFDMWFRRVSKPITFYEQSYLERWNSQLVLQWNSYIGRSRRPDCVPQTYLNYDQRIDYGKELNYKLFYYFRYMHEQCRIFDQVPGSWRRR